LVYGPLCEVCHGKVHGRTFKSHRNLQAKGIAKAKAAGVYMGRPETINRLRLASLLKQGLGATEIAKQLGIGRASVYRVMSEPLL
jgi:DNA invertase Pin-like site-specific DNA recombinase